MKTNKIFYFDDKFIKNYLASQIGAEQIDPLMLKSSPEKFQNSTFIMRGVTKHKFFNVFKKYNINFFYIDTGYFGNFNRYYLTEDISGKMGKQFYRIVFNNMQNPILVERDASRYKAILNLIKKDYNINESDFLMPWKKTGKKIILCPPSDKVCAVFEITVDQWVQETIAGIKKYSDREIVLRTKPQSRGERVWTNTMQKALDDDIFLLVTYNSIAATEAVIHGIPALTLGANAATPVSISQLKDIEAPIYPDRKMWLYNLSYEQFHINEIIDGTAWRYVKNNIK